MGGLDRWLCLARLRLNTCVHTCKLFPRDGGAARRLIGSSSIGLQVASSGLVLAANLVRTSIFFPTLNRRLLTTIYAVGCMETPLYSPAHLRFPTSLNWIVNEKPTLLRNALCPSHFRPRQHASYLYPPLQNSTTSLTHQQSSCIMSIIGKAIPTPQMQSLLVSVRCKRAEILKGRGSRH